MDKPRTISPAPKLALREPIDAVATPAPVAQLPAPVELRRPDTPPARIYPAAIARALLTVTRDIGRITKDGENTFQNYNYVRWDDIAERISPLLAEHGLIMVQAEKSRHLIEQTDKGSTLSIVYEFSFVNEHGECWPPVEWTALARLRDQKGITDDKAAAKCHTQAEKYFCIKQFKIRTGEAIDSDADGTDHQANARRAAGPKVLKKDTRADYIALQGEMDAACSSPGTLEAWACGVDDRFLALPADWQASFRWLYGQKMGALRSGHAPASCAELLSERFGEKHGGRMANGARVTWEEDGERPEEDGGERAPISHRAMMAESVRPLDQTDRGGVPAFLDRRGA